ncbi:LAGLIDADG family homing endonuclease [Candidatus Microgenomates bacterium]|nr:LAGLIDADG family homing endonuclease [Candidatus Microgenomates bacterium]
MAFSCDGGVNLYVARGKYSWLIRNVYLSCQHPTLIKQYLYLLEEVGIIGKILWQDSAIRIQGRKDIEEFASKIGFMSGVRITQNSTYWQGFEKQKVLKLAITSYGNPKIVYNLPQFRVKR